MDLYYELTGFCILTLGFLYGHQNDPMINIMIFGTQIKLNLKNIVKC